MRESRQRLRTGGAFCRDVKLENVFIANDGRVRLGDFGLTMSMKQEMAISPVGTVEYMAPEVRRARSFPCLASFPCTITNPAHLML